MRLLVLWTQPAPHQSDLQLADDDKTQETLRKFVEEWRPILKDDKLFDTIDKQLRLLAWRPSAISLSNYLPCQLLVKITKPGGHRDDMVFAIKPGVSTKSNDRTDEGYVFNP